MTSSPSFTSASIVKNMIGLAPGVTTTWSGVVLMPFHLATSATIASRSGAMPVAAV